MRKRDTGAIGENVFTSWCEPEEFRAQKSQFDRFGWDFMLEHEPARTSERPLDAQNDLPKFLVQVKATEKIGKPPRIKLSALKQLVDADIPSAIVIMFFSRDARQPSGSLLVPIDEQIMGLTLQRVRQEEARGNRDIHKVTITVPVERASKIGVLGEGLRNALFAMLHGSASDYIAGKIRFRRSCGYEGQTVIGRCFIPGSDAASRVSDLFLGGPRTLDVKDLTLQHRRFGIAVDSDRQHFPEAVLTMDAPPVMQAFVEFATSAGVSVSVEAGFWASPLIDAGNGRRSRFANSYFELNFDFEKHSADFTLDYGGRREVDIEEAVSIVEIGAVLASPERSIIIRFGDSKMQFPLGPEVGPFRNWVAAAPVLRRILTIVSRFPRFKRAVVLDDFHAWLEKHIEFLAIASTLGVHMVYPRWAEDEIVDDQDVILTPFSLDFLGIKYAAMIEIPIVSVTRTELEISIIGGQPRVVAEVARPVGSEIDDFIDAAVEKSKRERGRSGPALLAGGFSNWEAIRLSIA